MQRCIWSTENTTKFINAHRSSNETSVSSVINTAIERHQMILHHHMPDLSLGEWCTVFDQHEDAKWDTITIRQLWAEIADAPELGEKWGVDIDVLSMRLRRMEYASLVAVVDAIERFWASGMEPEEDGWYPVVAAIVGDDHIVGEDLDGA